MDDTPIGHLTHVRVLAGDYAACFRFYRDVLGLDPTFGDADSGYADFDAGDATLAVFDREEMAAALADADDAGSGDGTDAAPEPTGDGTCLVLGVESVDTAHERLREAGATVAAPPTDHPEWGIRTLHARDPAGTLVELNEPLEG